MIDRSRLFSKWNEVAIREQVDGNYICYECKLNNDKDFHIDNLDGAIDHVTEHKNQGHKMWEETLSKLEMDKIILEEAVTTVKVHYAIQNNGDGSATVLFFKTKEEASEFDENMDEGWGEDCSSSETLHFDKDGILINAYESKR